MIKKSDAVLYSDSEYMYTYKKDENVYTDDTGKTYNTEYSVVVESEGKCYVNWEYVAEHTDCEYEYGNEPERITNSRKRRKAVCNCTEKDCCKIQRWNQKSCS